MGAEADEPSPGTSKATAAGPGSSASRAKPYSSTAAARLPRMCERYGARVLTPSSEVSRRCLFSVFFRRGGGRKTEELGSLAFRLP